MSESRLGTGEETLEKAYGKWDKEGAHQDLDEEVQQALLALELLGCASAFARPLRTNSGAGLRSRARDHLPS